MYCSKFQANTLWIAIATSFGSIFLITLLFSLVRPYNSVVYAPKVKHADSKHAPPAIGRGLFAWFSPVISTKEKTLIEKVGLDAAIFLRFLRMCRNMFFALTVAGCGILIPVHIAYSSLGGQDSSGQSIPISSDPVTAVLSKMTPNTVSQSPMWAHVVVSYVFDAIVMFFLWWNYRAIVGLKRNYFQSPEYQQSLHSRSIWMTDIPSADRSDEGILRIADSVEQTLSIPRAAIARNVKELPKLIQEHEETVRKLESVLAKYLKNPDQLPPTRPTIKPSKRDHRASANAKVDAIDYLTNRIKDLETEINDVRGSIDKRNPMPYGFATYEQISEAHVVAYEGKKKKPHGVRIRLAPKPNDLVWENLPLSRAARSRKRWIINFWVGVLTVIWIVPNALIAVFLSNMSNIKAISQGFAKVYDDNPGLWEAIQAVLAPALLSGIYVALPIIFRRLSTRSGDLTKTSRERHVIGKLYAFFVFNNLIVFSAFSTIWKFVAGVTQSTSTGKNPWEAIEEADLPRSIVQALCTVSNFWFIWLIQRNLGAAIDLAQLFSLAWKWFSRTFMHPTPRQTIEWTAPPAFDYASYYNWFLFYVTVALSFATVQPLVLLVTGLYFLIDTWLKRYLILYIFITKTESGGQYWNVLFNRILFATLMANCVAALVIKGCKGSWAMLAAMIPLPLALLAFKWYCSNYLANQRRYYTTNLNDIEGMADPSKRTRKQDRIGIKFGHPALYKPLITPMVSAKAKHVLSTIYGGRLEHDNANYGYSDIAMDQMSQHQPGKPARFSAGDQKRDMFEVVAEGDLDFTNFKDRADFAGEHGGDGELYGRPIDLISERSGTPMSFMTSEENLARGGTPPPPMPRLNQQRAEHLRNHPAFRRTQTDDSNFGLAGGEVPNNDSLYNLNANDSDTNLLRGAQYPAGYTPVLTSMPSDSQEALGMDRWRTGGSAYTGTHGQETGYEPYRPSPPRQDSFGRRGL